MCHLARQTTSPRCRQFRLFATETLPTGDTTQAARRLVRRSPQRRCVRYSRMWFLSRLKSRAALPNKRLRAKLRTVRLDRPSSGGGLRLRIVWPSQEPQWSWAESFAHIKHYRSYRQTATYNIRGIGFGTPMRRLRSLTSQRSNPRPSDDLPVRRITALASYPVVACAWRRWESRRGPRRESDKERDRRR
jgi:hypothetical protein